MTLEECPSGRWSTLGKRVNVKTFRGFESHLLRIFFAVQKKFEEVSQKFGLRGVDESDEPAGEEPLIPPPVLIFYSVKTEEVSQEFGSRGGI